MLNEHSALAPNEQRRCDIDTVEELGRHIHRMAALLRGATNTGPDGREDEAWLVSMAAEEVEEAERIYRAWAIAPREGRA
jgi:Ser/Thr protein kinase RdoA (MazF antagonist)